MVEVWGRAGHSGQLGMLQGTQWLGEGILTCVVPVSRSNEGGQRGPGDSRALRAARRASEISVGSPNGCTRGI